MQYLVVTVILAAALWFVVRRVRRALAGTAGCGCGCDSGCPASCGGTPLNGRTGRTGHIGPTAQPGTGSCACGLPMAPATETRHAPFCRPCIDNENQNQ